MGDLTIQTSNNGDMIFSRNHNGQREVTTISATQVPTGLRWMWKNRNILNEANLQLLKNQCQAALAIAQDNLNISVAEHKYKNNVQLELSMDRIDTMAKGERARIRSKRQDDYFNEFHNILEKAKERSEAVEKGDLPDHLKQVFKQEVEQNLNQQLDKLRAEYDQ